MARVPSLLNSVASATPLLWTNTGFRRVLAAASSLQISSCASLQTRDDDAPNETYVALLHCCTAKQAWRQPPLFSLVNFSRVFRKKNLHMLSLLYKTTCPEQQPFDSVSRNSKAY